MKYLLTFLLIFVTSSTFTNADVKVLVTDVKGNISCSDGCDFKSQSEADSWVTDNISNDSWGKKERWEKYTDQTTCITIEEVMAEVDDISIPYPDPIPEGYQHPQVAIVDHQRCRMPVEYTILSCDTDIVYSVGDPCKLIADDFNEKKDKKDKDKTDSITIDDKLLDGSAKLEDVINILKIMRGL